MANAFHSGSISVDSDGVVVNKACKLAYVLFTPGASGDSIVLYDSASTTDNKKLTIKGATANQTDIFDLSRKPMSFTNGIYVDVTGTITATLVLTSEGAST